VDAKEAIEVLEEILAGWTKATELSGIQPSISGKRREDAVRIALAALQQRDEYRRAWEGIQAVEVLQCVYVHRDEEKWRCRIDYNRTWIAKSADKPHLAVLAALAAAAEEGK